MKLDVIRLKSIRTLGVAGAICLLASVPVRADVLEIGGSGPVWVAGGPVAAFMGTGSRETAAAAPVTEITPTAGPAAWRGHIAAMSTKYDLSPALLEAVVWQESRWNPAAVSPAGARGLAQLMPATARMLGVDPDDPLANLEGGARYLRQQLDAFDGNLEKALAAYNAGPGRVRRAGGIPAIRETQDYVRSILARLFAPGRG
jgi:soluble lytic murein transglycosylase-like protein